MILFHRFHVTPFNLVFLFYFCFCFHKETPWSVVRRYFLYPKTLHVKNYFLPTDVCVCVKNLLQGSLAISTPC